MREVGIPYAGLVCRSVIVATARAFVHVGRPVLYGLVVFVSWVFAMFAISGMVLAGLYVVGSIVGVIAAPVAAIAGVPLDDSGRTVAGAAIAVVAWLGMVFSALVRRRRTTDSVIPASLKESWRDWRRGWQGVGAELTVDRGAAWAINGALDEKRTEDQQRLDREESTYQASVKLGLRSGQQAIFSKTPVLTTGPITAYRTWKLTPGTRLGRPVMDSVLGSRVLRSLWPSPHMEARCEGRGWSRLHGPERLPVVDCTCGVYALKQVPDMRDEPGVWVVGEVGLWGRVLEGSNGFRAEHAQVVGPLSIHMRCAHPTGPTTHCGATPTLVVCRETEYVPRCEAHGGGTGPALRLDPDDFLNTVAVALTRRYGVDVGESEPAAA